MSTEARDLRELVATLLDDAGVAQFVPAPTGAEVWPVYFRKMPDGSNVPDRVLVISLYDTGAEHTQGVQVRVRGSKSSRTDAEDQAKAVEKALHGTRDQTRGALTLDLLTFEATLPLGIDANGREELAVNFHALTSDGGSALYFD